MSALYNLARPFLSESTSKKLAICGRQGSESLRETFLPHIPPEVLCHRFGGTKPCDLEFCCAATPILSPTSSFDTDSGRDRGHFPSKPGQMYEVPVEIAEPNSVLQWSFHTQGYETYFGVKYNGDSIIPLQPLDTQMEKVEGSVLCEQPGKYVLEFHNAYRKSKSNEVMCSVNYVNVSRPQVL